MRNPTNESNRTLIALILIIAMSTSMILLPTATAHTPAWQIPTYAYISASQNPVGQGQEVIIVVWLDKLIAGTAIPNDIRFHDYKLVITKPDGTTETRNWPVVVDTTSSAYTLYTPNQVGEYKLEFTFPGQTYTWTGAYQNDVYMPSSKSMTLVVQEEAISGPPTYPLPTEYWTRPIEGQNTNWYTIGSHWLYTSPTVNYNVQPDGIAPNTPHVMWTKLVQFGGIVGGSQTGVNGSTYYAGESYQERFGNPIIIHGRLYYPLPRSDSVLGGLGGLVGGGYVSVDLQTGEQYWYQNFAAYPSFGQLEWFDSPNQHGVIPNGYLWAASGTTLIAYDPLDGAWLFNITGVPSGTNIYSSNGELTRYQLNAASKWLALWNITQVITNGSLEFGGYRPVGTVINSTQRNAYSWNVTLPASIPAGSSIIKVFPGDILLGGTARAVPATAGVGTAPYTAWAVSLKPASLGQLVWMKSYDPPAGNITRDFGPVDIVNRVFAMADKETMQWSGYSLDTGEKLWGPVGNPRDYQYYSSNIASYNAGAYSTAYGNLYITGFGGVTYCYDTKNGNLLWSYGNGGEGNTTNTGLETAWGLRPTFISNIADEKIYLFNNEHSANSPLYKDAMVRCLNAYTGEEIWKLLGWASSTSFYSQAGVIADGYLAFFNTYDGQVYSVGKGPSATTVEAPMTGIPLGSSIMIRGTVTDIAAGTKQKEQAARFPNGVPAVSDESMSEWMGYVYQQKPRPTDVKGVAVTISVLDSNNNYREIGKTTTNSDGFFKLSWEPDIEGEYTVYAAFAGSEAYYPSHAVSAFAVDPAAPTPAEPEPQPSSTVDMYFWYAVAGIIATIAIIGIIIILMLRKRP